MNIPNLKDVISKQNWKLLVKTFLPVSVAVSYSFSEAMHIVYDLFRASTDIATKDSSMTDIMRDYCVNLMMALRIKYPQQWKSDWKNEAYLGIGCTFVYRYEEAFKYIQNAYKQLNNPPRSLILAYISSGRGPNYFLSNDEIKSLTEQAIKKGVTYESALRMLALATEENDEVKSQYWENQVQQCEKNKVHTPMIIPNVLKDVFQREEGDEYEK